MDRPDQPLNPSLSHAQRGSTAIGMGPIDPAVVQRAATWMARLWSDDASPEDHRRCDAWRAAHPDHEQAWRRLQTLSGKFDDAQSPAARGTLLAPVASRRRRALQILGLAGLSGGLVYATRETGGWQLAMADHVTRTGELRDIRLPDGTQLVLGTASAIDLRFDAQARRVVLRAGEISIATAADTASPHRPFLVQTSQGLVQALGTRFLVREDGAHTRVAVFEGAVEIRPAGAGAQPVRLAAGQASRFSATEVQTPVPVEENAVAWTQGVLVAERMRIDDFLAELGRYRSGLLRCDPAVAGLLVSGVFSVRDTDRALANLALGLPLDVVYRTRYWVTVVAR